MKYILNTYAVAVFRFFVHPAKQTFLLVWGAMHIMYGQQAKPMWTRMNPFEQRLFIEGKRQFHPENHELKAGDVLFYARFDGLEYYFTKNSIWISRPIKVKRNPLERILLERKISKEQKGRENEEEEHREKEILKWKKKEQFYCMKFLFASANVTVEGQEEVTQRFNYGMKNAATIQAKGYRKICYHHLYPGIDLEILFPEGKQGFKYNLLVQPGADPGQIAIQYPFNKNIQLEANNLRIQSVFGEFKEHAPLGWQENKPVQTSFVLKNKISTFQIEKYDHTLPLVIDPWVITPVFATPNNDRAYDVDWDLDGNCYIHGGTESSFIPYEVLKFDQAGNPVWTYVASDLGDLYYYYGDFAVDRQSQSVYISAGAHFGYTNGNFLSKLNRNGLQVASISAAQDTMMIEMWRIALNCSRQLVVVGGGLTLPVAHTTYVDTNLQDMKVNDIFNDEIIGYDAWGLTTDKNGNCYVGYMEPASSTGQKVFNNLVKLPLPSFGPITWTTPSGYKFLEGRCYSFHVCGNGYNGMCMSNNNLLTYDACVLKKWDAGNGVLQDSSSINGFSNDTMNYSGLTADECDHIFLAKDSIILQYNAATMKPEPGNTFTMPALIYDLALGNNNILYACGDRFVSAIKVDLPLCNPLITTHYTTHADCGKPGSDRVYVSGGLPPYTFKWNTIPVQTGDTAMNLLPGAYVVTIMDSSCPGRIKKDTVIISEGNKLEVNTQVSPVLCNGGTGNISVNVINGTRPYVYTWGTVPGTDSILKNVRAGRYTLTVSDSKGCNYTDTITLSEPLPITLKINKTDEQCGNAGGTITVEPAGGIAPYSFTWNNGYTGNSLVQLKAGTYNVKVNDANGCTKDVAIDIGNNMSKVPKALFTCSPLVTDMAAPLVHFQDQSTGAVKWYWNFGDGTSDSTRNPAHVYKGEGMYTVTLEVMNAPGCKSSFSISVTIYPLWTFYIPNSFTPNGDGINDTFNGKGEYIQDYQLLIFNRWGEQIFSSNSLEKGWDGKADTGDEVVQEDVYLYLVIFTDIRGKEHRYKGIVSLIK